MPDTARMDRRRMLPAWLWGSLSLLLACPSPDPIPEPSGTGGDDDMSEDPDPGPSGASCPPINFARSATPDHDPARLSAPAHLTGRTISLAGPDAIETRAPHTSAAQSTSRLSVELGPSAATTPSPQVHERWSEARRLEMSYCINAMPGDDAEVVDAYHRMIRAMASSTAEWERASGSNYIHAAQWDIPFEDPFASLAACGETLVGSERRQRGSCQGAKRAFTGRK